ncbi:hypothetical protein [Streptomyces fradiae]|uniref:hypothetical protein n=1 Tax=Streptomyces fradiae TaxID=1906 RepID=UPI003987BBA4
MVERFEPRFQGAPWPPGMGALHVYVLPHAGVDHELLGMVRSIGPLMAGYPIDPQYTGSESDAGLLHLTVEMLADAPSSAYDQAARDQLVDALRTGLAGVAPFTTEVGPPIANVAGVVLDVSPRKEVVALTEQVRGVIRDVRGEAALQHSGGAPHISDGYAWASASSDALNGVLRNQLDLRRAPLYVDRVYLLDVTWALDKDTGGWRMSWKVVAEIPLGGTPRQ